MKQLKSLFGIVVVVAVFYLAWVLIPPYYNSYSFQDEIDNQARSAVYAYQTTETGREGSACEKGERAGYSANG